MTLTPTQAAIVSKKPRQRFDVACLLSFLKCGHEGFCGKGVHAGFTSWQRATVAQKAGYFNKRINPAAFSALVVLIIPAGLEAKGAAGFPHRVEPVWSPPRQLRDVRVRYDCRRTQHGIGVTIQPNLVYPHGAIFLCPERARKIEATNPGASQFFLVHEYAHLFLGTRDEAAADRWAAAQLAAVPGGRRVLLAAVAHFVQHPGIFDPLYGSNLDRALRVAESGGLPRQDWPGTLASYERGRQLSIARKPVAHLELKAGYVNQAEMILVLDGHAIGYLSTQRPAIDLVCPPLAKGDHDVEAIDAWLYHREPGKRPVEVARRLSANCKLQGGIGKSLIVNLAYDEDLAVAATLR